MKKNLLKGLTAVAVALMFGMPVCAQTTETPYKGTNTADTWLRKNNTAKHGESTTIEFRTNADVDFVGVMAFEFPAPAEGYIIEKATLRLVSERVKADRRVNLYEFISDFAEDGIYETYAEDIAEAKAKEPIAQFSMEGQNNKSVALDDINAEKYQKIEAWQNNVDVTDFVKGLTTNKFGILIASAVDITQSNCFFTKEVTGITNKKCDYFNAVTAEDLVPQLTITYTVKNAINDITVEKQADGAVYNLAGQRVNNPQHGIYVKNGRKYIVK